jgi:hypothetical protein
MVAAGGNGAGPITRGGVLPVTMTICRPGSNAARMRSNGWLKALDEPIVLEDGTTLRTLQQAIAYLAKTVPKAEQNHDKVLVAADHLTRSAEQKLSDVLCPRRSAAGHQSERRGRIQPRPQRPPLE